jgi:uncharacterized membrane protein
MENLTEYTGFETKIDKTNDWTITTIASKNGISQQTNMEWNNKTVLANNV